MRCVAVGATLSSLTSLISSIAIARLIAFSCLSLCVYILHTVCIMNMDGPLAKYIHSGQQIHIILCLCVCVFGGGPPLSLFDDLDLLVFICRHAGDCRAMLAIQKECADRCLLLLYCTQIDGWIEEQQAAPGRLNEADTV